MRVVAELDFIHAKAMYAIDVDGMLPAMVPHPEMEWYHACHPGLLLSLARSERNSAADITLSAERRLLVISGPNAGGKSVTLKTVGIIQYMAQCGLLPPVYENSRI